MQNDARPLTHLHQYWIQKKRDCTQNNPNSTSRYRVACRAAWNARRRPHGIGKLKDGERGTARSLGLVCGLAFDPRHHQLAGAQDVMTHEPPRLRCIVPFQGLQDDLMLRDVLAYLAP